MRNVWRRGLSAVLTLVLMTSLLSSAWAIDPLAAGGYADVLISTQASDSPELSLPLSVYQRDSSNVFRPVGKLDFVTAVNRVSQDLKFQIIPQSEQVTLTVDYLTDLDQNGVYELLSGQDVPAGDQMTPDGRLLPASAGTPQNLTVGTTYTLTAQQLLSHGQRVIQERGTQGSSTYLPDQAGRTAQPDSIIYMVTVNYHSNADQRDYEQCYYLHLYDQIPAPSASDYRDVPADAWYYSAVDYVVSKGLLSGSSRSQFSPDQKLTRAMLAQTLYNMAPDVEDSDSSFVDVAKDAWCYPSVSWAANQGIMTGSTSTTFSPNQILTRQEMALTLYLFTSTQQVPSSERADLSGYSDVGSVSPWAKNAMAWAVSEGILTGRGNNTLAPTGTVSRAEFAAVLKTLCEDVLTPSAPVFPPDSPTA